MSLFYREVDSPIGKIKIVASDRALVALLWRVQGLDRFDGETIIEAGRHAVLDKAERQLREYFDGRRKAFDLPLSPRGTAFQQKVWKALREIPFGTTRSYGQLAKSIGKPTASRAVGAANGKNPIGIIVPCHRVIGANGHLTGFAGGLDIKEQLLNLERTHSPDLPDRA